MIKSAAFALIVSLAAFVPSACAAQAEAPPEAPQKWVPLTAAAREQTTRVVGGHAVGGHFYVVELKGVFARNEAGADYLHWTHAESPQTRFADVGYLTDRAARTRWEIDYKLKNVRRTVLDARADPEVSDVPMTKEVFLKSHAKDLPLGTKSLGGTECIAYRIYSKTEKKMFWSEVWFAPSLNFLPVREQFLSHNGKVTTVSLRDIRIGAPDPEMFHVPAGFSVVH